MKTLFLVLFTSLLTFSQNDYPWNIENFELIDWFYAGKYCDTVDSTATIEEYMTQWIWNGNVNDCLQPSEALINAFYDEETGNVDLWLLDSYECCCQVASTPGSTSIGWTGFGGSTCESYLINIGWDPMSTVLSITEEEIEFEGLYIDMFGRQHISPPKGLSIMNKTKYYRL
tara:strand:+ start:113 stop:628 length:516 start_codon:yes stop_codon:yes gene_type:complete